MKSYPAIFYQVSETVYGGSLKPCPPWVENGYLYATDSMIAVRKQWDGPDTEGTFHPVGKIDWDASNYESQNLDIADIGPIPAHQHCDECGGRGYLRDISCDICDGSGRDSCGMCTCRECEGKGLWRRSGRCYSCEGTGIGNYPIPKVVIGKYLCGEDIYMLDPVARFLLLNRAKVYLPRQDNVNGRKPIPLRIVMEDGVEGVVIPAFPPRKNTTNDDLRV